MASWRPTSSPWLAGADPNTFGLSIVTVDGHCYSAGDADVPFTIQSVSKPFAFGLALDHLAVDAVLERVGVEPTGDAFNFDHGGRGQRPTLQTPW